MDTIMAFPLLSPPRSRLLTRLLPAMAAIALAGTALPAFAASRVVTDEIDPVSLAQAVTQANGPGLRLAVQGNPFAAPELPAAVARIMAETLGGASHILPSAGPATGAATEQPHIALAFNPVSHLDADALCAGQTVTATAALQPLTVRAAACVDGRAQSAATGYLDHAAGPNDPDFAGLIEDLTQRLLVL
jgi:hypothetical protein